MRIVMHCQHADTCLPDYWGGHHLPHICVPVSRSTTMRELRRMLEDELRMGAVAGNNKDARLLSCDFIDPKDEKIADALTRAAYAAIRRDVRLARGHGKPFGDLDPVTDDDDIDGPSVYAYFVFARADGYEDYED